VTTRLALSSDECARLGLQPPIVVRVRASSPARFLVDVVEPRWISPFGEGSSAAAAIEDLAHVLRAESQSLRSRERDLSPALARELAAIDAILVGSEENA
jgi:hypothetical protein